MRNRNYFALIGASLILASCGISKQENLYADYDDVYNQKGRYVPQAELAAKATLDTTQEDYYDPDYSSTGKKYAVNDYDEDDYYYASRIRRSNCNNNYNYYNPYYTSPYYSNNYYGNCWSCNNNYWMGGSSLIMGYGYGYPNYGYGYGNPYYGYGYGNPYGGYGYPYGGYGYGNPYYGYGNPYYGYGNPYYGNGGGYEQSNTYFGHRGGIGTGNSQGGSYRPRRADVNPTTGVTEGSGYQTRSLNRGTYTPGQSGSMISSVSHTNKPVGTQEKPVVKNNLPALSNSNVRTENRKITSSRAESAWSSGQVNRPNSTVRGNNYSSGNSTRPTTNTRPAYNSEPVRNNGNYSPSTPVNRGGGYSNGGGGGNVRGGGHSTGGNSGGGGHSTGGGHSSGGRSHR